MIRRGEGTLNSKEKICNETCPNIIDRTKETIGEDREFYLKPIVRMDSKDLDTISVNDSFVSEIERIREDFQRLIYRGNPSNKETRKSRDERMMICKTWFILKQERRIKNEEVLISLIADRGSLFSLQYQLYASNHDFYLEQRPPKIRNEQDLIDSFISQHFERHKICKSCENCEKYKSILREIGVYLENTKQSIIGLEEFLNIFDQQGENDDISEIIKALRGMIFPVWFTSELTPQKVWERLKTLINSEDSNLISLKQYECDIFIEHILPSLFSFAKSYHYSKEECKHFRAEYTVCDKSQFQKYSENYQHLVESNLNFQKMFVAQNDLELSSSKKEVYLEQKCNIQLSNEVLKKLLAATELYCKRVFSNENIFNLDEEYLEKIVTNIDKFTYNDYRKFSLYFCLLFFEATQDLINHKRLWDIKRILEREVTTTLRLSENQLIAYLFFIDQVQKICELDEDTSCNNWEIFFKIIGCKKSRIWSLFEKPSKLFLELLSRENIPAPLDFPASVREMIDGCMPLEYDSLYCFRLSSKIKEGGFERFLNQYPDTLVECVKRLKIRVKHGTNLDEYLKEWGALKVNLSKIRRICQSMIKIYWNTIPNSTDADLFDFCISQYESSDAINRQEVKKRNEERAKDDVQELKMLLTEAAIRQCLIDQAKEVLWSNVKQIL